MYYLPLPTVSPDEPASKTPKSDASRSEKSGRRGEQRKVDVFYASKFQHDVMLQS